MTSPKRLSLAILFALVFETLFPILGSLEIQTTYAYATETKALAGLQAAHMLAFDAPKTSFVLKLKTDTPIEHESDVSVTISNGKLTKSTTLEIEGDEWMDGTYFTSPLDFAPSDKISIKIDSKISLANAKTELVALDTESGTPHLALNPDRIAAHAAAGVKIVSRAEWGADESLRYKDSKVWKNYYDNLEKTKNDPVSDATKKYQQRIQNISAHLREKFPEEFDLSEVINSQNGHELVWPIEKTKQVRRVVLHHTAENLLSDTKDEALMRSMYYYHTVTRGWGDIGYNYVVGQRGVIYEGRAGGDYAVGAHAAWNNSSTVGISVIGNFEVDNVNSDQEAGIRTTISYVAKKYGINLASKVMGHKECKSRPDCLTDDTEGLALVGHRDVGYTSCPGANLYAMLPEFRTDITAETRNYVLVTNPIYKPETIASKNKIELASTTTSKWPTIRVKLSAPTNLTQLRLEAAQGNPVLKFDQTVGGIKQKSIVIRKKGLGKLELVLDGKRYQGKTIGLSADVIRIANWDRKPSWDTSGKYNDNTFRGKIEARMVGGKIEIINELPLEDYLKGIAEISNGDNPEKMKTIIVAARSYALWYTDPTNRKFPGKDYDGSDDPEVFQKYLGYGYEQRSAQTAKIVDSTNGQVVTYSGSLIKPWYFNESDGKTRSAKQYCESNGGKNCPDIPYLQSVDDPGSVGHTRKGHGVGISGIGATYFATQQGWDFQKIISYYLTGTKVEKKY